MQITYPENIMFFDQNDYYIEPTVQLDHNEGIWISKQTLGSRINFVKPHIHSAIELLYFIVGDAKVIIDGVEYFVSPGDTVLFRSNSIHQIYSLSDAPATHFVLQLKPSQVIDFSSVEHGSYYLLRLSLSCRNEKCFWSKLECDNNGITESFNALINENNCNSELSDIKIKIASARILLAILKDICCDGQDFHKHIEDVSGCIYSAIVYINSHYYENITAESCAKRVFMSYGHFSRSFKKATNMSFKDYLNKIRVNHAQKALLCCNRSIAEISHDCGFNTVSYFISIFKKLTGETPAIYRNNRNPHTNTTEH